MSFSAEDPTPGAVSPAAIWLLPVGALAAALFVLHERRAPRPLLAAGELRSPGAYGALLTNLAIGAALMAALLDVPVLARATADQNSQLGAALVLLRLLVGVPIGALLGGWLSQRRGQPGGGGGRDGAHRRRVRVDDTVGPRRRSPIPSAPGGCIRATRCSSSAGSASVSPSRPSTPRSCVSVRDQMHGLASALVVVARMIGMLVGISILTAVGLHIFYVTTATLPLPQTLCPSSPLNCPAYGRAVTAAIVTELRAVFLGAGVCAAIAAVLAAGLLRGRPARLSPAAP